MWAVGYCRTFVCLLSLSLLVMRAMYRLQMYHTEIHCTEIVICMFRISTALRCCPLAAQGM